MRSGGASGPGILGGVEGRLGAGPQDALTTHNKSGLHHLPLTLLGGGGGGGGGG